MIEVKAKYVDGVQFVNNVRITPPYEYEKGVRVEIVDRRMGKETEVLKVLRSLGLKQVGTDLSRRADIYASYPVNFIRYKITMFLWKSYWLSVWWLYDNTRMFKQIPAGEIFSLRYFTPYCWWIFLKRKLKNRI